MKVTTDSLSAGRSWDVPEATLRFEFASWARKVIFNPDITARAAVVLPAIVLLWWTWGRWGSVQIDCGREIYVPYALSQGKSLYRDVWYPYGPVAPYFQAAELALFGLRLSLFYLNGFALALASSLLLFSIARQFLSRWEAVIVSWFFLIPGFSHSLFNYVFPYSYAAMFGLVFSLACLWSLVRHCRGHARQFAWVAAMCAGLASITKPEFGAACFICIAAMVAIDIAEQGWTGARELLLATGCGVLVPVLVYGYLFCRFSPHFILYDNLQSTPGSYFMRTFGAEWVRRAGMRFVPSEVARHIVVAAGILLAWYGAILSVASWSSLPRRNRMLVVALLAIAASVAMTITPVGWQPDVESLRRGIRAAAYPNGVFWMAAVMLGWAGVEWLRTRSHKSAQQVILALFAVTLGLRVMAQSAPYGYSIYYDAPLILIFVIWLTNVMRSAASGAPKHSVSVLVGAALVAQILLVFLALRPPSSGYLRPLSSNAGTMYVPASEADEIPDIVRFIETKRKLGKTVLVLPELPIVYALAGSEAPTRWYEIVPGIMSPDNEREYVRELEKIKPDYVLISNRNTAEYGVPYFGIDYAQNVYRWIDEQYRVVGSFGRFARRKDAEFAMLILSRETKGKEDGARP